MSNTLHRLCRIDEVEEGTITEGHLPDGHRVAIYKVGADFYCTDELCTHGEASLIDEGSISGCIVECAWHFGAFDVTTGQPAASPCTEPLRTYRVTVQGDELYVEVQPAVRIVAQPAQAPGG